MKIKINKNEKTNKVIPALKNWLGRHPRNEIKETQEAVEFGGLNFRETMAIIHVIK